MMSVHCRLEASDSVNEYTLLENERDKYRMESGPVGSSEDELDGQTSNSWHSESVYDRLFNQCIQIPPSDPATSHISCPSISALPPPDKEPPLTLLPLHSAKSLIVQTSVMEEIEIMIKPPEKALLLNDWKFNMNWPFHEAIHNMPSDEWRIKVI